MNASDRPANLEARLTDTLLHEGRRCETLETLRDNAPFAWITGGFVRNAVWDAVFEMRDASTPVDVDVVYLGGHESGRWGEMNLSAVLRLEAPGIPWSVKDQARMHIRNHDRPYRNLNEALSSFPDRSSAIAVRLLPDGTLDTLAPFGLKDAFRGFVRPTPAGLSDGRYAAFLDRKLDTWRKRWPRLLVVSPTPGQRRGLLAA